MKNIFKYLLRTPFSINLSRNLKHYYALKYKQTNKLKYFLLASKYKGKQLNQTMKLIDRNYSHLLNLKVDDNYINETSKIYVIWLQGEDKMTSLSKFCYQSILKNSGDKEVKLVTLDNLKEFNISLPDFIFKNLKNGKLSYTNVADLIRIMLLARHKGIYMDLTIYLFKQIDESLFDLPYVSINSNRIFKNPYNLANFDTMNFGQVYFLGGTSPRLYKLVEIVMLDYIKKHHKLPFYEFLYYVIEYFYLNDENIRNKINQLPTNNSDCEILSNYLDENDVINYSSKINDDTFFIKLSNKASYSNDFNKIIEMIDNKL